MFELLKTVDDFLEGKSNIERIKGPVLSVEEGKLPKEPRILVLSLK
jgi:hypothetical protein